MTMLVITTEAEDASALLFQTLGAHRTAVAALRSQPPPRLPSGRIPDPEQIQCQSTLVRLLSITESFTSQLLLREVDKAAARARSASIDSVWEEAATRGTSTWREQQAAYINWLGVKEDWKVAERLAEARNAVAHGLGTLTRRQRRNEASVRSKLKEAGITLTGIRIVLSDAALASAASACRDLIHRIDLAVQARPSEYR
jgi:hypothetical protein